MPAGESDGIDASVPAVDAVHPDRTGALGGPGHGPCNAGEAERAAGVTAWPHFQATEPFKPCDTFSQPVLPPHRLCRAMNTNVLTMRAGCAGVGVLAAGESDGIDASVPAVDVVHPDRAGAFGDLVLDPCGAAESQSAAGRCGFDLPEPSVAHGSPLRQGPWPHLQPAGAGSTTVAARRNKTVFPLPRPRDGGASNGGVGIV
jgi:hypothetical protein